MTTDGLGDRMKQYERVTQTVLPRRSWTLRTGAEETVVALRSWWQTRPAPHFVLTPGGFLADTIPALPGVGAAA